MTMLETIIREFPVSDFSKDFKNMSNNRSTYTKEEVDTLIAEALADLGVDYLEGGWPGANTLDTTFFNKVPKLGKTILTAFGMTKKSGRSAQPDPGLS